jgi:type VI secretion system secreted protein Hcp
VANQLYIYITGQKSGKVKGSVTQRGREDSIAGLAISHSIVSPRDPQSGLPTGQRQHKPFVFTKAVDKSTPVLLNILCTNENLTSVEFRFWRQVASGPGVGSSVQYYSVRLTNANIASYNAYTANPDQLNQFNATDLEEFALTYQKIEWTWSDGGITAMDDWEARV